MLLRMDCQVYVEVDDTEDPEEVAGSFNSGFEVAIEPWPNGVVELARVRSIHLVSEEEAEEEGLVE